MPASLACAVLCAWLAVPQAGDTHARAAPDGSALPIVRLIATGGTIAARADGWMSAEELVASVPGLNRVARVEAEQFSNVSSGELTLRHWLELSRRITALFRGSEEIAGIVVTTGTDTLEELAYFLHLTVRSERPVVVVGAMRTPFMPGSDGPGNLLAAFRVAAAAASRAKGALVVYDDEVASAREVTKAATIVRGFDAGPFGPLGVVYPDGPVYHRAPLKRHTHDSEFDLTGIEELPRVDIVMTYQDAPGDVLQALIDRGARGLVIAAAGAGSTSGTQTEGLHYAFQRGVPIVVASRTAAGRVPAPPTAAARLAEVASPIAILGSRVAAEDLAPVKARILLMLALTRTRNRSDIQRMFSEY